MSLQFIQLFLQCEFLLEHGLQVNGGNTTGQLSVPILPGCRILLLKLVNPCFRLDDLLLNSLQNEIFTLFDVFSILQYRRESELEGHIQLGSANSCCTVSGNDVRSSRPCLRKRLISGKAAMAWSSTGSVPF